MWVNLIELIGDYSENQIVVMIFNEKNIGLTSVDAQQIVNRLTKLLVNQRYEGQGLHIRNKNQIIFFTCN